MFLFLEFSIVKSFKMWDKEVIAHNVRFYDPVPRAIHCMAIERKNQKLALSRSDNSIEIWDIEYMPYLQKSIFNEVSNTVEDIKWHDCRLFSCGLQGSIVEYDCYSESVMHSVPVTGGPAWCLDICSKKNLLACGTEGGYINVMEIMPEGLEHYKFLDKQQGRILCICWDSTGQHLVTGSTDVIRIWNVDKGHAIHKMTTGRSRSSRETIVWSLCVTSDFTIISGDSRGYLCFWDGKIGTQIESIKSHGADIFSVILKRDESAVICSGVDPLIAIYGRVSEITGGRRKWAKGGHRRIHDLDVRALALSSNDLLYSGAVDGYLCVSATRSKILMRLPPFCKGPCAKVVPSKRYLMLRYLTHLEVWKLGLPTVPSGKCDSLPRLAEKQTLLLELKAREGDVIISSSLSTNGEFIAYSTNSAIRFFKLSVKPHCSLIKLPDSSDCGPCRIIEFYQICNRHYCAAVTKRNEINIMEVGDSGPDIVQTIKPKENELLIDTISHLLVTSDASFLIAADCSGNVVVWSMSNWSYYCNLPKCKAAITAIAVNDKINCVVVAYSDHQIVAFSLKEKKYTDFTQKLNGKLEKSLQMPVLNITFDPRNDSAIIVQDGASICALEIYDSLEVSRKVAKVDDEIDIDEKSKWKVSRNVIKKPEHLVSVDWLEGGEMVVVSVSPLKLAENFPPVFRKKRFLK